MGERFTSVRHRVGQALCTFSGVVTQVEAMNELHVWPGFIRFKVRWPNGNVPRVVA